MIKSRRHYRLGQSSVEIALATPVIALLLLAAADLGRLFYTYISLNSAVRAGAQYGAQSRVNAANTSGIENAITNDSSNITLTGAPTVSQCTCISGSNVAVCSSTYPCSDNPGATFVTVTASTTFKTIMQIPGFPSSTTLTSTAITPIQQ
jgi:Flp pilus assembly protein TadG